MRRKEISKIVAHTIIEKKLRGISRRITSGIVWKEGRYLVLNALVAKRILLKSRKRIVLSLLLRSQYIFALEEIDLTVSIVTVIIVIRKIRIQEVQKNDGAIYDPAHEALRLCRKI